ncbi:putative heterokaryon incompatibility protein [Rosellinia necatrix]|uniref:Putative heterokaryon incompatibility protein n=1 Tax=Rosellinia necatrix TaxID=77044 RepID=A0A1W2TFP8_ROSNE|nr:putative heterokaryon incompatibility protein [Rosellinia necatrix]
MTDVSAFCVSPDRAISYGPLSITGNEIRILVLEPPSPEDSRVRGRLEHASLYDLHNDFVALSYYWGDHNALKRIVLGGEMIPITFNLYKALDELRRRGHYRVWVDDLCINQYDDEERGRQVLRMGSIYRSASMVFAHLRGPGIAWQVSLAEAVQRITRRAEAPKRGDKDTWSQSKRDSRKRKKSSSTRGQSLDRETLYRGTNNTELSLRSAGARHAMDLSAAEETALFLFLDNPFWRRAWIIQEIAVNPRLTIVWGRQAFDLSQLVQAFSLLSNYVSGKREKVWNHIKRLYKIRTSQLALKPLSLVDALGLCYLAKAQFIRDHVFALLGLTHDGAYLVPFPSYALPQEDISRDMTIRLIRATGSFDVVVSKGNGSDTWYPNWFDSRYWHAYRLSHMRIGRPSLLTYTSYGPYRASGHHNPTFSVQGEDIVASGFFLGSIVDCSPTMDEARESGLPKAELLQPRAWKRNSKNEKLFFGPGATAIMKALCWLLIDITRPRTKQQRPGTHLYTLLYTLLHKKERIIEQVPALMQWFNCCEAQCFKIDGKRLGAYFSMKNSAPLSPLDREILEEDCDTMQRNLKANMRLGYTDEGEMGWFHHNARAGDQVAILLGSSMPCVLRQRSEGGYMIVGQCIIDGVMKGEAVRKGLQRLQDIQLH